TVTPADSPAITYTYNGDNLLVERSEGSETVRYYYDGPNIIAEGAVDSLGNVTKKAAYVRGIHLVAMTDSTNTTGYYLHNGHSDVVELRDATGATALNVYTYDIWGSPTVVAQTLDNPFLYS